MIVIVVVVVVGDSLGHGLLNGISGLASEVAQVDLLALRVDNLHAGKRHRERLGPSNLTHHGGDLVVAIEILNELGRVHSILRCRLDEVLGEFVLRDLNFELLDECIQKNLGLQRLLGRLNDLGAVLVVIELAFLLEVTVDLVIDDALGQRNRDILQELLDELVPCLLSLPEDTLALHLSLHVLAKLGDGVELAGDLSKLIVSFGQFALFHGQHSDLNECGLSHAVATEQLRLKGGGFPGSEGV